MEPMTLGSPLHSPVSVGSPSGPSFLPEFLMGENTPTSGTPTGGNRLFSTSPSKLRQSSVTTPQTPVSPPVQKSFRFAQSTPTRNLSLHNPPDKHGGPPVQSLRHNLSVQMSTPQHGGAVTPIPATPQLSFGASPAAYPSLEPTDSLLSQDKFAADVSLISEAVPAPYGTWITVFGFPAAAKSFILSQFTNCGTILEYRMANNGNWMHIHYQTHMQAKKALCKNGKVFGGSIMVGVAPCTDKSVMDNTVQEGTSLSESLLNCSNLDRSQLSNIRPLTQAFKSAQAEHEVQPQIQTPTRSSGIVAKAMEYMFGW